MKKFILILLIFFSDLLIAQSSATKVTSINLTTEKPVKIVNLVISLKNHPLFDDTWQQISLPSSYPNEKNPLQGTFADGTLLRDYLAENGSIGVDEWYVPQMEEYFSRNSNEKFNVSVNMPKTPDGKTYQTDSPYERWVGINGNSAEGLIMRYQNWRSIGEEVLPKLLNDQPDILDGVKLLNIIYLVNRDEFTRDSYSAFSPDIKHGFVSSTGDTLYNGYITMLYNFKSLLHETLHRLGSLMDEPMGFEGLPDRTTLELFDYPQNMTWGFDAMCNKDPLPSERSLYGTFPMLALDKAFLGWIPQEDILVLRFNNAQDVKLIDVNKELTDEQRDQGYYRLLKVIINKNFSSGYDEYFLCEFRNGSDFDRNFYNIYENYTHTGLLIWHIKENSLMLNRRRNDDHFIDLEVAVPYNGWHGNPIPDDNFPRNYLRPFSWQQDINGAGDFDYLDDDSSSPFFPDGGVHKWELTDNVNTKWAPYFLRRNSMASNFFTNREVRGVVTNKFTNSTRPSSKDWAGRSTDIAIYDITQYNDYMTVDVSFDGGILSIDQDNTNVTDYELGDAYPNPFNSETNISFQLPAASFVSLNLYDSKGELVKKLANKFYSKGKHNYLLNASELSSGVYFYRFLSKNYYSTKKILLLN